MPPVVTEIVDVHDLRPLRRGHLGQGDGPLTAHRDFLPYWAALGGCRLSAWLGMDVKPPVHMPEGDKRFADPTWSENPVFFAVRQGAAPRAGEREEPPPMGSGRHQAIADATGSSAKLTASEVHHG